MLSPELQHFAADAWAVLLLFIIPIGGGIPGGVLLAKNRDMTWPMMEGLYLISDIMLAFAFEPITWIFLAAAKRVSLLARMSQLLKESVDRTIARFGIKPGPLTLILISFGADPMTGRSAALAAGHGFVIGWSLAIAGDMIFFTLIMVSTIWLNDVLGDGTWATVIIIVLMTIVPYVFRRLRGVAPESPQVNRL